VKCYTCGKTRHVYLDYAYRKNIGGGEAHISKAQKKNVEKEMKEEVE